MKLEDMVKDFTKRSFTDLSEETVLSMLDNNYSIVTDNGFICFNFVYEEAHCFFCYVAPGNSGVFENLVKSIETLAKIRGCKKIKFVTKRDKAFARAMKDYKPCAVMFERSLV